MSRGRRFLREYVRTRDGKPGAKTFAEIQELGADAIAAGAEDPIVQTYAAVTDGLMDRATPGLQQRFLTAYQGLVDSDGPHLTRWIAADWIWLLVENKPQEEQDPLIDREHFYRSLEVAAEFLASESDHENQRFVWAPIDKSWNRWNRKQQTEFLQACWHNGGVNPWITHLVAGWYFKDLAWTTGEVVGPAMSRMSGGRSSLRT